MFACPFCCCRQVCALSPHPRLSLHLLPRGPAITLPSSRFPLVLFQTVCVQLPITDSAAFCGRCVCVSNQCHLKVATLHPYCACKVLCHRLPISLPILPNCCLSAFHSLPSARACHVCPQLNCAAASLALDRIPFVPV